MWDTSLLYFLVGTFISFHMASAVEKSTTIHATATRSEKFTSTVHSINTMDLAPRDVNDEQHFKTQLTHHKTTYTPKPTLPSRFWSIALYSDKLCGQGLDNNDNSGYLLLQGYNDQDNEACLAPSLPMSNDDSKLEPWCQWYPGDGGNGYKNCSESTLKKPESWKMYNDGHCTMYSDNRCQTKATYIKGPMDGCYQNQHLVDPVWTEMTQAGSFKCSIWGPGANSVIPWTDLVTINTIDV